MDKYLVSLCKEYIQLVDSMNSGLYGKEEIEELSRQRSVTHDELIRITEIYDRSVMYKYCKHTLWEADQ